MWPWKKVKVPKSLSAFYHVHVLDSREFGQNQLTQSEDNVYFCPKFSSFCFVCDLENKVKVSKILLAYCHIYILN